jgi:hypothetical protein
LVDRHLVAELMRRIALVLVLPALAAIALGPAVAAGDAPAPEDRGLPSEKASLEQHAAQVQAEARASAAARGKPDDPLAHRPPAQSNGRPPTGVLELSSPFRPDQYLLGSVGWQSVDQGERTTLYAGSLGSDHSQGVVLVTTASLPPASRAPNLRDELDGSESFVTKAFVAPSRRGSLEVRSARGDRVLLASPDGATVVFDVSARRFVEG